MTYSPAEGTPRFLSSGVMPSGWRNLMNMRPAAFRLSLFNELAAALLAISYRII